MASVIDTPAPSSPRPARVSPALLLGSQAASGTAEDFAAVLSALGTMEEEETGGGGGGGGSDGGGSGGEGSPSPERFAVAGRSRPVIAADLVWPATPTPTPTPTPTRTRTRTRTRTPTPALARQGRRGSAQAHAHAAHSIRRATRRDRRQIEISRQIKIP